MANLPESNEWPEGVYQLETSDPVLGGPEGIDNLQAKQLASRTKWLRAQIKGIVDGVASVGKATQLATARALKFKGAVTGSGDFDGSADVEITLTLAKSGVLAGSYSKVAVNEKGIVTEGAQLSAGDLPGGITAPRFDNDTSLATTEFVNDAAGGFRRAFYSLTQGQIITASMVNSFIYAAGTVSSATLPLLSSVPSGSTLTFAAISSSITLLCQGTDAIWATAVNAVMPSIKVNVGDTLALVATPFGWVCTGGSAMFAYQANTGVFAASLGFSGYKKDPGGLITQWGSTVSSGTGLGNWSATFPITFPNACLSASILGNGGATTFSVLPMPTNALIATAMSSTTGERVSGLGGFFIVVGY